MSQIINYIRSSVKRKANQSSPNVILPEESEEEDLSDVPHNIRPSTPPHTIDDEGTVVITPPIRINVQPRPTSQVENEDQDAGAGPAPSRNSTTSPDMNSPEGDRSRSTSIETLPSKSNSHIADEERNQAGGDGHAHKAKAEGESKNKENSTPPNKSFWGRTYIIIMLKLLYYLGVVPYDAVAEVDNEFKPSIIHYVAFACITIVSLLQALAVVKATFLFEDYSDTRKLLYFVTLGFDMNNFCFRLYFKMLFWLRKKQLLSMLRLINHQDTVEVKKVTFAMAVLLSSLAYATLYTVLYAVYYHGYDFEDITRSLAQEFSIFIFAWESNANATSLADVNVTTATTTKSFIWWSLSGIGRAEETLIKDAMLMLSMTMWEICLCLIRKTRSHSEDANPSEETCSEIWDIYQDNTVLRRWTRDNYKMDDVVYNKSLPGGRTLPVTASVVVDELESDPIGVGSSIFFLNKAFLWKSVGVVGSFFMFFVNSIKD